MSNNAFYDYPISAMPTEGNEHGNEHGPPGLLTPQLCLQRGFTALATTKATTTSTSSSSSMSSSKMLDDGDGVGGGGGVAECSTAYTKLRLNGFGLVNIIAISAYTSL
jgi:hypothetical protein